MHWTGNLRVHLAFEILGYLSGATLYASIRKRGGDPHPDRVRALVFAGAALGAALGSRLLFVLCEPMARLGDPAAWFGGKTIVGGLLGGLIGVEIAKARNGITRSTGDVFVAPLVLAMAIGRIGCFLAGPIDRTAGLPTSLPWGLSIDGGPRRHPVALYEIGFLLLLLALSSLVSARTGKEGDRFRTFLAGYLAFRFLVDFLKPEPPPLALGLSAIQWACAAGVLYYVLVLTNADRNPFVPFLRRRGVDLHDVLPED